MLKFNKDVLFLIFELLQDDINTLHSCLLVNKTWCEMITPILWKNPWKIMEREKQELQFNLIISHLSDEVKESFSQCANLSTIQQKPLLNYIILCRHLKLPILEQRLYYTEKIVEKSKLSIVNDEIHKLFINRNTKFTHLHITSQYDYQIHLIPGAEHCFSQLKYFRCFTGIVNQDILEGLSRISKLIEKLKFKISQNDVNDNSGVIKLIEAQKNLKDVQFICYKYEINKSFCKTLEESLIKHADTIQHLRIYWEPITKIFSYLVNLISLELMIFHYDINWNYLENVSLPALKFLRTRVVPSNILVNLIENTQGCLTEINVEYEGDNKELIQVIYQNCPNLKYLKLMFYNSNILELEQLLINCQYLSGLGFDAINTSEEVDWNGLFEMLIKSSPTSLFKFKFYGKIPKMETLKLFLDNWEGRNPMLLQTIPHEYKKLEEYFDLIEKYKAKGVVKKYDNDFYGERFKDFEWIEKT